VSAGVDAGLALSLASAFALNWGFLAQHGAASALPPLHARQPVRSLRSLFADRRWLGGFAAGLCGWALYVGALALAPLSLVQATAAGGIGILALLIQLGGHDRLDASQRRAVAVALTGLVLLGLSLGGSSNRSGASSAMVVAWLGVSVGGALAGFSVGSGVGLGAAAGMLYSAADVATKAAVGGRPLFVPAVLVASGLGGACLQLGFQRGDALSTVGLSMLLTNALPIAAGMLIFGEALPGGLRGVLRVAAFALVTLAAALLARSHTGAGSARGGINASSRGMRRKRGGMYRSSASDPSDASRQTAAARSQSA
jgi:hypothetical protein